MYYISCRADLVLTRCHLFPHTPSASNPQVTIMETQRRLGKIVPKAHQRFSQVTGKIAGTMQSGDLAMQGGIRGQRRWRWGGTSYVCSHEDVEESNWMACHPPTALQGPHGLWHPASLLRCRDPLSLSPKDGHFIFQILVKLRNS